MYWNTVRAELCQTKIAVALFDWAVNTGPV
ncbi:MAG TPA: hypothetical protein DF383_04990, partial [Deltaproteobacteria bacterium]|nr:hypothetical protein [Deltaproteobacteria bacterium]